MKIGILGGTFDPIHFGHIRPALEVQQQLALDEVWLMPNHIPPHKNGTHVSTDDRLAMAQAVCEAFPPLKLCAIEALRESPSYTVTTLQELKLQYPQHEFYFLMGMDSFLGLQSWYQWQDLFELCHLVVCQRPGSNMSVEHPMHAVLTKHECVPITTIETESIEASIATKSGLIFRVSITEQPFSSTQVRADLYQGLTIKDALPVCIQRYIKQHQLYASKAINSPQKS
ncbi:Cytidyltransferase-like:Probable nicotinate-nucleotide adenylyltransferase [Shewanella piezotolerans WP3]|uniref:Probable nicotinate-nucleotide adenylyltransferase n=1 Tax=Shewanella piezotolerans (strain WP3 / JCM 13877) TaxID=225849 RepID=B8CSG6_SHEPW|nr:nicotinate-nucleotide adenylyltransferase [Shewanella piezotolerans]ACJ30593.1 Cytidyltransferase-like:Probable nicotinate-nucleotide adenylyltransferase [Shewanella piezotolerans WP3]